jgi:oxazoline/thiazoline synthase
MTRGTAMRRPLLRPDLRAVVVGGEQVVLFSERAHVRLKGGPVADVLPLVDGVRAPEDVVALLDGRVAPEEVYYTLLELERRGYLVEADDVPRERVALLAALGVSPAEIRDERVRITAVRPVSAEPLLDALAELGVGVDTEAPLHVVLADDYLREELEEENLDALATGRRWLVAKPVGTVLWVGPLFVPGETGCWVCLAHRLREHRPLEELAALLQHGAQPLAPTAHTAATTAVAAGLVAVEVAKELAGNGSTLRGRLWTLDLATLATGEHALSRRPQCPACGDPALLRRRPERVRLRPLRAPARDGGERVLEADETVRRLSGLVSPITGIVSSLERVDDLPAALHIYTAGRVPGPEISSPEQVEAAFQFRSSGKGPTDAQARASALCEGAERYSACWREPRHVVEASYLDVADRAVHPDQLLLFSEMQRRERQARNAAAEDRRSWIPEPFDPSRPVEWTQAWSITYDEPRLLPTAYCFMGYALPEDHRFCRADSNGCAAGNEPEEAILQGLLELVERDAVALWWYNRLHRPRIDLAGVRSSYVAGAVEAYAAMGRAVWALDLTTDLGIPAIAALSCSQKDEREVAFGFGAHLDAEIALGRALGELTQMTIALRAARREADLERWLAEVTTATDTWLAPDEQTPLAPVSATGDLAADIRAGVDALARAGHETLVVDLTLPDVRVPVVKVVAPGLRHFWPRFGPGRLYDVPVALGWLEQPTPETDLNPFPVVW